MTPELVLSFGKIMGSVALLAAVLVGVARLGRRLDLDPEVSRKIIHVGLGLYCLGFPLVFTQAWEVAATCILASAVFVAARASPARILMSVVLPAPFGPSRPKNSPSSTDRLTPLSA